MNHEPEPTQVKRDGTVAEYAAHLHQLITERIEDNAQAGCFPSVKMDFEPDGIGLFAVLYAEKLDELIASWNANSAAIQRVRDLHYQMLDDPRCKTCGFDTWPCNTIRALDALDGVR